MYPKKKLRIRQFQSTMADLANMLYMEAMMDGMLLQANSPPTKDCVKQIQDIAKSILACTDSKAMNEHKKVFEEKKYLLNIKLMVMMKDKELKSIMVKRSSDDINKIIAENKDDFAKVMANLTGNNKWKYMLKNEAWLNAVSKFSSEEKTKCDFTKVLSELKDEWSDKVFFVCSSDEITSIIEKNGYDVDKVLVELKANEKWVELVSKCEDYIRVQVFITETTWQDKVKRQITRFHKMKWIENHKEKCVTCFKTGTYYNPADKHYGKVTKVRCDFCDTEKLPVAVGSGDAIANSSDGVDLCLECVHSLETMCATKKMADSKVADNKMTDSKTTNVAKAVYESKSTVFVNVSEKEASSAVICGSCAVSCKVYLQDGNDTVCMLCAYEQQPVVKADYDDY